MATRLRMPLSGDTVLRILHRTPEPAQPTPRPAAVERPAPSAASPAAPSRPKPQKAKSSANRARRTAQPEAPEQRLPTGSLSGGLAVLHALEKDEGGGALPTAAGALLLLVIACAASLRLTARLADAGGDFRIRPS